MNRAAGMTIAVDCSEYEIERIELVTNQVDLICRTLSEVLDTVSDMSGKKIWEQDDLPKEAVRQNLSNEVFRPIAISVILNNGMDLYIPFDPETKKEKYKLSAWHLGCPEDDEEDSYQHPGEAKAPTPLVLAFMYDEYEKKGQLPEFFELLGSGELERRLDERD